MYFCPFVILSDTGESISVAIDLASKADLAATHEPSEWQTDWTSEYLSAPSVDKYAVKTMNDEIIALSAYQIRGRSAY